MGIDLALIWAGIILFGVMMYVVMDGFDLGIGILFPLIADAEEQLDTVPNRESAELRWVAEDEVADLPLHPGFAASWDRLREVTASLPLKVNPQN